MQKTPTASALAAVLAMGFFFSAAPSKAQEEWQKQVAQALGKAGTASGVSVAQASRAPTSGRRSTVSSSSPASGRMTMRRSWARG
jgi:hypothetical protein